MQEVQNLWQDVKIIMDLHRVCILSLSGPEINPDKESWLIINYFTIQSSQVVKFYIFSKLERIFKSILKSFLLYNGILYKIPKFL